MKTHQFLYPFLAAGLLLTGCKKDNGTPGFLYQVKVANTTTTVNRVMAGTVQWTSGFANAHEIEFEAEKDNTEVEYKQQRHQRLDLFAPLSTLSSVNVPPGRYDEIKFEVEVQPHNGEPAFQLNGQYTSNGTTTPVVFKISTPLEIETEKDNFTVTDGGSYTALTTLNLALLTQGITEAQLNNATRTNGTIEISATSNQQLFGIMFDRLRNCGGIEIDD
jgi:hypothetical protein